MPVISTTGATTPTMLCGHSRTRRRNNVPFNQYVLPLRWEFFYTGQPPTGKGAQEKNSPGENNLKSHSLSISYLGKCLTHLIHQLPCLRYLGSDGFILPPQIQQLSRISITCVLQNLHKAPRLRRDLQYLQRRGLCFWQ
jgi:hypothetical protein